MTGEGEAWGIFGGGFGLYGYLPALVNAGVRNVSMLERHRCDLLGRIELREYVPFVSWVATAPALCAAARSLVIALPPAEQERILGALSAPPKLRRIVLEKPLGQTPARACEALSLAQANATSVRVGYSFLYTDWAAHIAANIASSDSKHYTIEWRFMAHHFQNRKATWKAQHEMGGGILRFYGIQLLAFAETIHATFTGLSRIDHNVAGQAIRWTAQFEVPSGSTISIEVDCCYPGETFKVTRGVNPTECLVELKTPFGEPGRSGAIDGRVDVLRRILATFDEVDEVHHDFYGRVNALWKTVEAATVFEPWTRLGS